MSLSNRSYDLLKRVVQIILPAIGALYAGLAIIWGGDIFPRSTEVVGSIALVATFLGTALGISSGKYNKGTS